MPGYNYNDIFTSQPPARFKLNDSHHNIPVRREHGTSRFIRSYNAQKHIVYILLRWMTLGKLTAAAVPPAQHLVGA